MRQARALVQFMWDFVVGDDWRIAAGVVLALALTALVADTAIPAWWILPLAAAGLLAVSVWRATTPTEPREHNAGPTPRDQ